MAEGKKHFHLRNEREGERHKLNCAKLLHWIVYISLTVFSLLAVVLFLQLQIISLRKELENLKLNLPSSQNEEETPRNVKKRSSAEFQHEAGGIQAVNLHGNFPFQHIQKQGKIGPWIRTTTDDAFVRLREQNTEIEIIQSGIYFIYAQVYYLTSQPHNSFQILTYNGTEPRKLHRNLSTCSSQGRNSIGEVSCYSGFVWNFHEGQRLYLNQIEQNRIIHFAGGSSFFGLILLNKKSP